MSGDCVLLGIGKTVEKDYKGVVEDGCNGNAHDTLAAAPAALYLRVGA